MNTEGINFRNMSSLHRGNKQPAQTRENGITIAADQGFMAGVRLIEEKQKKKGGGRRRKQNNQLLWASDRIEIMFTFIY